jgi:hypothetical protein
MILPQELHHQGIVSILPLMLISVDWLTIPKALWPTEIQELSKRGKSEETKECTNLWKLINFPWKKTLGQELSLSVNLLILAPFKELFKQVAAQQRII